MELIKEKIKDIRDLYTSIKVRGKAKIFCIGLNKTGTTSLQKTFQDLGYTVGDQKRAERLMDAYRDKNFEAIVEFSKTAQVFQDFPFSFPETFKYLDRAFPDAKFILSVRDNPDQWYDSLVAFHSKMFGKGKLPTVADLKNATYARKGWAWESFRLLFGTTEQDGPYEKEKIVSTYVQYNQSVMDHFKGRNNLLVINLSDPNSYNKFCNFLNIEDRGKHFPWENKTDGVTIRK